MKALLLPALEPTFKGSELEAALRHSAHQRSPG
jgi:hypothetical protein